MYFKNHKWLKFVVSILLCQNAICGGILAMRSESPIIEELNKGNIPVVYGSKRILVKNLKPNSKNNINLMKSCNMSPIVEETIVPINLSEKYANALVNFRDKLIKYYKKGTIKFVDVIGKSDCMLAIDYEKLNNDSLNTFIECLNCKLKSQRYDEINNNIDYCITNGDILLIVYKNTYRTLQPNNSDYDNLNFNQNISYHADPFSKYSNNFYSSNTFSGIYNKNKPAFENFLIKDAPCSSIVAFKIDGNLGFIVIWDKKSDKVTFFNVLRKLSFESISFAARNMGSIDGFIKQLNI